MASVISKEDRERVKKLVLEAFNSVPKPEHIAAHDCDECKELSKDLKDRDWHDLEPELIDFVAWEMPLLTPEASRYFLPATIIKCLDEWLDPYSSDIFPSTIMALVPSLAYNHEWERYRFNTDQHHAIHEFLKLVRNEPMYHLWHSEANVGLGWYKPKQ
jgi:hypothetical protein